MAYEVFVDRGLHFSAMRRPLRVTFYYGTRLVLNASCMHALVGVTHVLILIDEARQMIAIRPCESADSRGYALCGKSALSKTLSVTNLCARLGISASTWKLAASFVDGEIRFSYAAARLEGPSCTEDAI